jgi:amino acid/peptide:H+ symporter
LTVESSAPRPVPFTAFEKRFGHPPGLIILFFAEMWERFSYYGMRGLLKLYMVNYLFVMMRQAKQGDSTNMIPGDPGTVLGWETINKFIPGDTVGAKASILYGLYTGLVYLTPVFGGMVADRLLGQRKTVVVGGILMAIGHFVMAFEDLFFVALLLLILGNGAFKPNISTQVGLLYPAGDPRRDGAFTIFYMGINLGAFICNFICGTLAAVYGWHYGFAAAGVGMVLGLIVYLMGQKYLAPDNFMVAKAAKAAAGNTPAAAAAPQAPVTLSGKVNAITGGLIALDLAVVVALIGLAFTDSFNINHVIALLFFVTAAFFTYRLRQTGPTLGSNEWKAVIALVALCALNVVFWAVYEQQGNTMQTWADEKTVWPMIGSFQIPSTWFQSFNPLCIILFAPFLDRFWAMQDKRGGAPSSVTKMAIGCVILGLSFIVMVVGAGVVGDGKGSMFWPLFCTLLLTIGELYLSPIGLSLVTKVAPARIVSMMMGMWFLSSFLGNYLSGFIGTFYEDKTLSADAFFILLTVLGVVTGLAMFAFNKPLKKAIGAV